MLHNKISDLKYSVQSRFKTALEIMNTNEKLKELGVEKVVISESLRDLPTQMAYFSRGRMEPQYVKQYYAAAGLYAIGDAEAKQIVTQTLRSNHMDGTACDFVPVKDGKTWWTAPDAVWETMGLIGEECGLKWGGRWKDFKDSPHFEA